MLGIASAAIAGEPSAPRQKLDFNPDWRFQRADSAGAEKPDFDDASWATVSCPHTWNDVDTFDNFATSGHQGESRLWKGTAWYRKTFTPPASIRGRKVYIEFEGVRQIADVYLNGRHLGRDKTGFIPFGFDLTPHLRPGETNVLAVRADNTVAKQFTGDTPWNHQNWHPPHGGIYRNVYLHICDPLHVTLPLHAHLGTEGIYSWVRTISKEQAALGITAEIQNDQGAETDVTVRFSLIDHDGRTVANSTEETTLPAGAKAKVASQIEVAKPHLWAPDYPYVYQVRVAVTAGGVTRDVADTAFGIRNFRFDTHTGFWINGRPLKLHGWGHKPTQEWPGLGAALPDWLTDLTLRQMWQAGGNFLRWGHSAGPPEGARCADQYGFVTLMPGVDGERDCDGEAWKIRTAAFRDMIIYYRNHPSICIWEGGNYNVSPEHAAELRAIVDKWDPEGRRYFGFRMAAPGMLPSLDIELGTVGRTRAFPHLPVVETEYDRTETPRRVWDSFSPPDFGRLGEHQGRNTYNLSSEGFAVNAIREWWTLFGSKPDHSGGANWIFCDGTHGSRQVTDVARATGEVDAARLPKEAYFALQATWHESPRVHLIGHWNYPTGTVKAVHAVARADSAELFVNGRSLGKGDRDMDTLFTWKNVRFEPGEIRVVSYRDGKPVAEQTKRTAGEPAALRLTPVVAPGGWRADGSDVALVDVEVVDAKGRRCPTDQARVDFEISGPAVWRGGYNSGKEGSTNSTFFDTECGINRASLRSTLRPGRVTITASRPGLEPTTIQIESNPVEILGGALNPRPSTHSVDLPPRPEIDGAALAALTIARNKPTPAPPSHVVSDDLFSTFAYTGNGPGGLEAPLSPDMLAYSDDAVNYLTTYPDALTGSRLIRTALKDRGYWANDYIVATAARELDLFIAHDPTVPTPEWLDSFRPVKGTVKVNQRQLPLRTKRLRKGEVLRIPGNADQGQAVKTGLNFILFARPSGETPQSAEKSQTS
ncbi:MAG: glycoside hydrolase family 2 protein [Akkermansiaceae bacterium]|nr:glycoside hydrolase family 2 protein [Akkermansiaceae bacterium]MCP5546932.1 glycoside hydrolase family 2 protein [Akkermansiaceae bacterium]